MKKVTAVVPMKLNNRRLPQKNTKSFTNGKPLCYYILSTLLKIEGIDDVYVYCSNPDIREFIPEGVKYLKRSETLDTDSTKMNDVLKSFAMEVDSDIYVMTHTTAPFVKKESIIKRDTRRFYQENMIRHLLQKNYRIFFGKIINHLIMNSIIFQERRICRLFMKKLVGFISMKRM